MNLSLYNKKIFFWEEERVSICGLVKRKMGTYFYPLTSNLGMVDDSSLCLWYNVGVPLLLLYALGFFFLKAKDRKGLVVGKALPTRMAKREGVGDWGPQNLPVKACIHPWAYLRVWSGGRYVYSFYYHHHHHQLNRQNKNTSTGGNPLL